MLRVSCYFINKNIRLEEREYNNPPCLAFIKPGTISNDLILIIPLGNEGGVVYSDLPKADTKKINYNESELGEELISGYKLTQGVDVRGLGTSYGHKPTVCPKGNIIIEYKKRDAKSEEQPKDQRKKQLETQKNASNITETQKEILQSQIDNISILPQYQSSFYYFSKDKDGIIKSQKIESGFTGNRYSLIACPNLFFAS